MFLTADEIDPIDPLYSFEKTSYNFASALHLLRLFNRNKERNNC